jgi:hypothetical protein
MKNSKNSLFSTLDTTCETEIIILEKMLFKAFSKSNDSTINYIWDINHETGRIKTKIDYGDQTVFTIKIGGRLVTALAINQNNSKLQLQMLNFTISKPEPFYEILYLFSTLETTYTIELLTEFFQNMFDYLSKISKINTIYATCNFKQVNAFRRIGLEIVDKHLFMNEYECLLKMNIDNARKEIELRIGHDREELIQ